MRQSRGSPEAVVVCRAKGSANAARYSDSGDLCSAFDVLADPKLVHAVAALNRLARSTAAMWGPPWKVPLSRVPLMA
jgi:hypothetical protein